jgi:hypothetical protein
LTASRELESLNGAGKYPAPFLFASQSEVGGAAVHQILSDHFVI